MTDVIETTRVEIGLDSDTIVGLLRLPQARGPLTAPTLLIHSENALAPALAHVFEALADPRAKVWIESKSQIDFHDDPERLGPAAGHLAEHFREDLGG